MFPRKDLNLVFTKNHQPIQQLSVISDFRLTGRGWAGRGVAGQDRTGQDKTQMQTDIQKYRQTEIQKYTQRYKDDQGVY